MKIPEFNSLQMTKTNSAHTVQKSFTDSFGNITSAAKNENSVKQKSFETYLIEAMNIVNNQQLEASDMSRKLVTEPDSVDIHDITTAMAKAQMSLSIAQTVIDRVLTGWNEITTTR